MSAKRREYLSPVMDVIELNESSAVFASDPLWCVEHSGGSGEGGFGCDDTGCDDSDDWGGK